jgi:hypothetical protein
MSQIFLKNIRRFFFKIFADFSHKNSVPLGGYAAPSQDAPVYSGGQDALGGYAADAGAAGNLF